MIAGCESLPAGERKAKDHNCFTGVILLLSFSADRGAVANVAHAYHNSNRKVFDEWVFSCQRTRPFTAQRRKGQRAFVSLCPNPHLMRFFLPITQDFFQPFFRSSNRFCYSLETATLHFCNLFIGQPLKIVKRQTAPLCFRKLRNCPM